MNKETLLAELETAKKEAAFWKELAQKNAELVKKLLDKVNH